MSVHFSKATDEWSTPEYIWRFMEHIVGKFKLDAAATSANAVCKTFFGPGSLLTEDALQAKWPISPVWCNPPYSQVGAFMEKALKESQQGGGHSCLPSPSPYRHQLVAPIRNQGRDYISAWAAQVWRPRQQRPLPISHCHF